MIAQANNVVDFELPDRDTAVMQEIGFVNEDITRLEGRYTKTVKARDEVDRELADLKRRYQAAKSKREELAAQADTEKRMLAGRRRVLLDLQAEIP